METGWNYQKDMLWDPTELPEEHRDELHCMMIFLFGVEQWKT